MKRVSVSCLWRYGLTGGLVMLLIGCAAYTPFKWSDYRKLHVGMPESQVIALMGRPAGTNVSLEGNQVWSWVEYNRLLGSGKFANIELRDGRIVGVSQEDIRYYPSMEAMVEDHREHVRIKRAELEQKERCESQRALEEDIAKIQNEIKRVRADYVKNNPEMPEQFKDCILNEKICLEMTCEQVEMSWGAPDQKRSSTTTADQMEEWIYSGPTMLKFENGVLVGWETTEQDGAISVAP